MNKATKNIISDIILAAVGLLLLLIPACAPKPVTREKPAITEAMLRNIVITSNDPKIKIHNEWLTDFQLLQLADSVNTAEVNRYQERVDSLQAIIDSLVRQMPRDPGPTP